MKITVNNHYQTVKKITITYCQCQSGTFVMKRL